MSLIPQQVKNRIGEKFGRLTVIEFAGCDKRGSATWKCRCECGNIKIIRKSNLTVGHTKSCGCLRIEEMKSRAFEPGVASFNDLFGKYKIKAKRRNLDFNLSKQDFGQLTKKKCHYCGQEPSQSMKKTSFATFYIYNGIDRVDSQKGYIRGNCVTACWKCNYMKNALSVNEFIAHINKIIAHQAERIIELGGEQQ